MVEGTAEVLAQLVMPTGWLSNFTVGGVVVVVVGVVACASGQA